MSAPSVDMKDLLVAANVGVFGAPANPTDWGIFVGEDQDEYVNTITLFDIPGDPPNPKFLLDFPRFMIRVRSYDYLAGWTKAQECKSQLLGLPPQDIDGTHYDGVYVVTETFFLQADSKGRKIFVTTYRIISEPSSGVNRISL